MKFERFSWDMVCFALLVLYLCLVIGALFSYAFDYMELMKDCLIFGMVDIVVIIVIFMAAYIKDVYY